VQEKLRRKEFSLYKIKGDDNPADLMTKHLPSDKMVKHLHFMGAQYREGRPETAPMRKEHEQILGEDMDWQLAETARNKVDDQEVEMRLLAESAECHGCDREKEELMGTGAECRGCDREKEELMGISVGILDDPAAG
jgi:hypothetical protein